MRSGSRSRRPKSRCTRADRVRVARLAAGTSAARGLDWRRALRRQAVSTAERGRRVHSAGDDRLFSWNRCVYCDMYRDKDFRIRDQGRESLADIALARSAPRRRRQIEKVFVADGDALIAIEPRALGMRILDACKRRVSSRLRRVSCYAMAHRTSSTRPTRNSLALREAGLVSALHGPRVGRRRHAQAHRQGREPRRTRRGLATSQGSGFSPVGDLPPRRRRSRAHARARGGFCAARDPQWTRSSSRR